MTTQAPGPLRPRSAPSDRIPSVSRAETPRFGTDAARRDLAAAFLGQDGAAYDAVRPGYPEEALDLLTSCGPHDAVDLGAGSGALTRLLAARGLSVTAVDTSPAMLAAQQPGPHGAGSIAVATGRAEATGLPAASADLVTAAQSWHWFDPAAASAEAARLLRPGGVLGLVWNTLDVSVPWVHRLSRIMHSGDVQRPDFRPGVPGGFRLLAARNLWWDDHLTPEGILTLAGTRSYVLRADEPTRQRVLGNLAWYLYEHLGHAPGEDIALPYRCDAFVYAPGPPG